MRYFHFFLTLVFAVVALGISQDLYRIRCAKKHSLEGTFLLKNIAIVSREKQKNLWLLAANKYKRAALWCPTDPVNWAELGKLYWLLGQRDPKEKTLLNQKAKTALLRAQKSIPLWGEPYFYLGKIYLQQQELKLANCTMAMAHFLALHNTKLAFLLANHWWQRVQKKTNPYHFVLMQERFHTLNQISMEQYSISTLAMWQLVTKKTPWGNILDKTEHNALSLGLFYFRIKQWNKALEFLEKVQKKPLLPKKYLTMGNIWIARDKSQKALQMYQKAISLSPKKIPMLKKICQKLIVADYIEEAFTLLQAFSNTLPMHNFLLEKALKHTEILEVAPFFAAAKEKFPQKNGQFYFLLSQFYQKMEDIPPAIFFAEKAIQEDYTRESYAKNYCLLLFRNKMQQKIAYYLKKNAPYLAHPTRFYSWIANIYRAYGNNEKYKFWKEKASMDDG